jgi:hypothetical protein
MLPATAGKEKIRKETGGKAGGVRRRHWEQD